MTPTMLTPKDTKQITTWVTNTVEALQNGDNATDEAKCYDVHDETAIDSSIPRWRCRHHFSIRRRREIQQRLEGEAYDVRRQIQQCLERQADDVRQQTQQYLEREAEAVELNPRSDRCTSSRVLESEQGILSGARNEFSEGGDVDLGRNHDRWNKARKHLKKGAKIVFRPISKPVKAILGVQKQWSERLWATIEAAVEKYDEGKCYKKWVSHSISATSSPNPFKFVHNKDCAYLVSDDADRTCHCSLQDVPGAFIPQSLSAPASLNNEKIPEAHGSFSLSKHVTRKFKAKRPQKIRRVQSTPITLAGAVPSVSYFLL